MKHFYSILFLALFATATKAQQPVAALQPMSKGQTFTLSVTNTQPEKPRFVKGLLKTIGIGALTY